jgi:phosphoribosylaminoimidazole carboxylase (NCAIR synthetase)
MDKEHLDNLTPYLPLLERGKLHLYGKTEAKTGRKMGHINLLGDIEESLRLVEASGIWANKC